MPSDMACTFYKTPPRVGNVVLEHTFHLTWAIIMTRPHSQVASPIYNFRRLHLTLVSKGSWSPMSNEKCDVRRSHLLTVHFWPYWPFHHDEERVCVGNDECTFQMTRVISALNTNLYAIIYVEMGLMTPKTMLNDMSPKKAGPLGSHCMLGWKHPIHRDTPTIMDRMHKKSSAREVTHGSTITASRNKPRVSHKICISWPWACSKSYLTLKMKELKVANSFLGGFSQIFKHQT